MNRRQILARAAAATATAPLLAAKPAAASVEVNPDAQLIPLCKRFHDLEVEWRASFDRYSPTVEGDRARDAYGSTLRAQQDPIIDEIDALPAPRTTAGCQVLARAFKVSAGDAIGELSSGMGDHGLVLLDKHMAGLAETPA